MTVLTDQQRKTLTADLMQMLSSRRENLPFLKADLLAAVSASDDWAESNTVSYNSALPQPFRGIATPDQKSGLLEHVIARRRKLGA